MWPVHIYEASPVSPAGADFPLPVSTADGNLPLAILSCDGRGTCRNLGAYITLVADLPRSDTASYSGHHDVVARLGHLHGLYHEALVIEIVMRYNILTLLHR